MSTSSCPQKELCGSCSWSDIAYSEQLEQKLSAINAAFETAKLDSRCQDILPSPKVNHYRNRMDFVIDFQGKVGLRERGKWWRVIDNHHCFISDERIEAVFIKVREWVQKSGISYFDRKKHTGLLRFALVRASLSGDTLVSIITSNPTTEQERTELVAKLEELALEEAIGTLVWAINYSVSDTSSGTIAAVLKGGGFLEEVIGGIEFRISPHAFFQTNSAAAELLLKEVVRVSKELGGRRIIDMYCGSGFFTLALAGHFKEVVGVELVPEAIADARFNAERNGSQVRFELAPSEDFDWSLLNPDVIVVDPPRGGMHARSLAQVLTHEPRGVVYVSCNYKNFAADLVQLSPKYRVRSMTALDMFPHTPHVELVCSLERIS